MVRLNVKMKTSLMYERPLYYCRNQEDASGFPLRPLLSLDFMKNKSH